jgi:xanthine dehydrogenase YagR molybdenum-binding subunit
MDEAALENITSAVSGQPAAGVGDLPDSVRNDVGGSRRDAFIRRDFLTESAGNILGRSGIGEIGAVGVSVAIANAVYHAAGRVIRSLPITVEQLS